MELYLSSTSTTWASTRAVCSVQCVWCARYRRILSPCVYVHARAHAHAHVHVHIMFMYNMYMHMYMAIYMSLRVTHTDATRTALCEGESCTHRNTWI